MYLACTDGSSHPLALPAPDSTLVWLLLRPVRNWFCDWKRPIKTTNSPIKDGRKIMPLEPLTYYWASAAWYSFKVNKVGLSNLCGFQQLYLYLPTRFFANFHLLRTSSCIAIGHQWKIKRWEFFLSKILRNNLSIYAVLLSRPKKTC